MKKLFGLLCAVFVLIPACGGNSTTSPSTVDVPYSQTDLTVGNGPVVVAGNHVNVNYSLWLYSPSATDNKGTFEESGSFPFTVGAGQAIKGFDQGVVGMAVGGKRRLIVPPSLAYGSTGSGKIPPNATLVFEVELVSIG
jgi:FKBP-type peptidyl-prolyl cis-trans isomerase FkpA